MENKLKKKYGMFTAICMVVGIVIGSGVFFKAQDVLKETAGDALMGVFAWLIGGSIMAVLAMTFGVMATKYEKVGGVVDYAESTCGRTYAYFFSWFLSFIYYPAMTSVLAWVSARYTIVAINGITGSQINPVYSTECIILAALYLIAIYFMNAIAPRLAGKFQVSTTVIKFMPIVFIAIVGTVYGLVNGILAENLSYVTEHAGEAFITETAKDGTVKTLVTTGEGNLFAAVCCTVFAYEGWIIATSINAEIKNAKRNLPIALGLGAIIIVAAYVLYYVGIVGLKDMITLGNVGTSEAFGVFGKVGASIINILIVVSCLGTLNGLMLGCTRGVYAMAARGEGIAPKTLGEVDRKTNMPHNSAAVALFVCVIWMAYFVVAQNFGEGSLNLFGDYGFDSSELPVVTIYPLYIPVLIMFMIKAKDVHPVKRFVLPALSVAGTVVVVIASIMRHKMDNVWYLIVFAAVIAVGALFFQDKNGKTPLDKLRDRLGIAKKVTPSDSDEDADSEGEAAECAVPECALTDDVATDGV